VSFTNVYLNTVQ